jgi:hypothetical protein
MKDRYNVGWVLVELGRVNGGDESKGILLMGFKYNNEISSNCLQVN